MDDRSIDATARLMAEAGFLLGPYTLSRPDGDQWDQYQNDRAVKGDELDEFIDDEYEPSSATGFIIPADPQSSRL